MKDELQFRDLLRSHGLRCTPDRLDLFRILREADRPLTRPALVEALQADGIHATTVYRTLEQFMALGWLQPVLLAGETVGYELRPPFLAHHHHFICTHCGTIVDLPAERIDRALEELSQELPGEVERHQVDFYGTCRHCLDAARGRAPLDG
jgi:Fe2+ or Zn2+ uptake regulation protein